MKGWAVTSGRSHPKFGKSFINCLLTIDCFMIFYVKDVSGAATLSDKARILIVLLLCYNSKLGSIGAWFPLAVICIET